MRFSQVHVLSTAADCAVPALGLEEVVVHAARQPKQLKVW
jgi:hypothetical protein